jgi:hypothetical protein
MTRLRFVEATNRDLQSHRWNRKKPKPARDRVECGEVEVIAALIGLSPIEHGALHFPSRAHASREHAIADVRRVEPMVSDRRKGFGNAEMRWGNAGGPSAGSPTGPPYAAQQSRRTAVVLMKPLEPWLPRISDFRRPQSQRIADYGYRAEAHGGRRDHG